MKIKFLSKKDQDKPQEKRLKKNLPQKDNIVENIKKERNIFQIPGFEQYSALMKLRLIVSTIFLFITITIILLIFAGNNSGMWQISAILFLLGYLMLFILLFKLFRVKKL